MAAKLTALSLEDLVKIREAYINGAKREHSDEFLRRLGALNEALRQAQAYHPLEHIVLARGVFTRNERQLRRERSKKLEETLQLYALSVVPSRDEKGRPQEWTVGSANGNHKHKDLKQAIAAAVSQEVRKQIEAGGEEAVRIERHGS